MPCGGLHGTALSRWWNGRGRQGGRCEVPVVDPDTQHYHDPRSQQEHPPKTNWTGHQNTCLIELREKPRVECVETTHRALNELLSEVVAWAMPKRRRILLEIVITKVL